MNIKAKTVLENKFWIVEQEGQRIGTITKQDDSFILSQKGNVSFYKDELHINKTFGNNFLTTTVRHADDQSEYNIHGFPTKGKPYNVVFDISNKLPLFTKGEKSKSVYCAGYYIIKFNVIWLKSFCPKLITIEQNNYRGPFKTSIEMKAELKHAQSADNH